MQLIAQRPTLVVVGGSTALLLLGVVVMQPVIIAWCGAILLTIAYLRASLVHHVAAVQKAGFEMAWLTNQRYQTLARHRELSVRAELRNHSARPVFLDSVRAIVGAELSVTVHPQSGQIAPGGGLVLTLTVTAERVGIHGIQGVSLLVSDGASGFQVPLFFHSPTVLHVTPLALSRCLRTPPASLLGTRPLAGPALTQKSGDSMELRELREYLPSDPRNRVAWKASARRGILLVRDDELEQRETLWFILDASVELWAGTVGQAALDEAIDQVALAARRAIGQGHHVGLTIVGGRQLSVLQPQAGQAQLARITYSLSEHTTTRDADRSGLDPHDVAAVVLEHLSARASTPLPEAVSRSRQSLAAHAETEMRRFPVPPPTLLGVDAADQVLRQYLAVHGLPSPARLTADRPRTSVLLGEAITSAVESSPSQVVVCAPFPTEDLLARLGSLRSVLRRRKVTLAWLPTEPDRGVELGQRPIDELVSTTMKWQMDCEAFRGHFGLRRLGIRTFGRVRRPQPPVPLSEPL